MFPSIKRMKTGKKKVHTKLEHTTPLRVPAAAWREGDDVGEEDARVLHGDGRQRRRMGREASRGPSSPVVGEHARSPGKTETQGGTGAAAVTKP